MSKGTKVANGTVVGLFFFSGPVRLLEAGLNTLGVFGDVDMALELVKGSTWTADWDAIWNLVLVVSFFVFVAMNWPWIKEWARKRRASRTRVWNRSASWAVCAYLPHLSVVGHGMKGDQAWQASYDAFISAASEGDIDVAGRRPGKGKIEKIRKKYFRIGHLDHDSVVKEELGGGGRLVSNENPPEVLFDGLLIDSYQIEDAWPHRRDRSLV